MRHRLMLFGFTLYNQPCGFVTLMKNSSCFNKVPSYSVLKVKAVEETLKWVYKLAYRLCNILF